MPASFWHPSLRYMDVGGLLGSGLLGRKMSPKELVVCMLPWLQASAPFCWRTCPTLASLDLISPLKWELGLAAYLDLTGQLFWQILSPWGHLLHGLLTECSSSPMSPCSKKFWFEFGWAVVLRFPDHTMAMIEGYHTRTEICDEWNSLCFVSCISCLSLI